MQNKPIAATPSSRDVKKLCRELNKLDYSVVEFKLREKYPDSMIKRMKREGIRFFTLCATQPTKMSPSFFVDEFWHQCILTTRLYLKMAILAGRFVQHYPSDGKKKTRKALNEAFWNTIQSYENYFGKPDLEIWDIQRRKQHAKSTI